MLQLKPNCELCDRDLPADAVDARICSYECTFCADCVNTRLHNVCPNCGGGFEARPIRPAESHRTGVSRSHHPPTQQRARSRYSDAEIAEFSEKLHAVEPRLR